MILRRDLVIPSGFRTGRVFVRLKQIEPGTFILQRAAGLSDATHQLVDVCGLPVVTHLMERDPAISGEMMHHNCWEFAESVALLLTARPGMTFVDVGANVGYYSVILSKVLQDSGRIFAFEPDPENHLLLNVNALLTGQLFPEASPIKPFRLAASDADGTAQLHQFERNLGLHTLTQAGRREDGPARSVEVETARLDGLRFGNGQEPPWVDRKIDIIKADTQGSELMLLRGAERTLQEDRPILCLEFEPYLTGPDSCIELVRWIDNHGYGSFRLFHANAREPYQVLSEFGRVLTADEVINQVRLKAVGPYGSLFAFPDTAVVETKP